MLLDLLAKHLDFLFFIDISVRVEDLAEFDRDGSLDLAFVEHDLSQLKLFIFWDVVCVHVFQETLGIFLPLFLELGQVLSQSFEMWSLLCSDCIGFIC